MAAMTRRESLDAAFLRAVCEEPHSDTPRLVFSDWLEEQGGADSAARAEFIRVQIELARRFGAPAGGGPAVTGDKEADAEEARLRLRGRDLLRDWRAWVPPFVPAGEIYLGGSPCRHDREKLSAHIGVGFRRGFVAEVMLTAADFLTHAGALFAAAPIERVTLTDKRASEPMMPERAGSFRFYKEPGEGADVLPEELFDAVYGEAQYDGWYFSSKQEAIDALSAACVTFGRRAASLPPLKGGARESRFPKRPGGGRVDGCHD